MSDGLLHALEHTVDQLVTLALEEAYLMASATDQWIADLWHADSLEQVAGTHEYFLRELQRIAANDVSCRLGIVAAWFGAPSTVAGGTPTSLASRPDATLLVSTWQSAGNESPLTVTDLAAAGLDAINLKALRRVLYDASPARSVPAEEQPNLPAQSAMRASPAPDQIGRAHV